jgi:hypothetical protein
MLACWRLLLLLAILFLLAAAPTVFANSIAPTAYFMPGVLPWMFGMAVPASVLAAFLERPFVKCAGVRENALWYSLQANLVSLVIGYLTMPVGIYAIYTIGPLWPIIAVAMSVISEGCYYRWRCPESTNVRWLPVVAGNVFSSFVIVFLPGVTMLIKEGNPSLEGHIAPYQDTLLWGSVGGCALLFVASFFVPSLRRGMKAVPNRYLAPENVGTFLPRPTDL